MFCAKFGSHWPIGSTEKIITVKGFHTDTRIKYLSFRVHLKIKHLNLNKFWHYHSSFIHETYHNYNKTTRHLSFGLIDCWSNGHLHPLPLLLILFQIDEIYVPTNFLPFLYFKMQNFLSINLMLPIHLYVLFLKLLYSYLIMNRPWNKDSKQFLFSIQWTYKCLILLILNTKKPVGKR